MREKPRKASSIRKVPYAPAPRSEAEGFDYEGEREDLQSRHGRQGSQPVSQPEGRAVSRAVSRSIATSSSSAGGISPRKPGLIAASSKRNFYPYILGSTLSALIVGLLAVVYLLATGNKSGAVNPVSTVSTVNNPVSNGSTTQPVQPALGGGATGQEPDLISMADFRALYDDPATRPPIIDVRSKEKYGARHIAGAVNIPVAETDTRLSEFPNDKLIVLYCQ